MHRFRLTPFAAGAGLDRAEAALAGAGAARIGDHEPGCWAWSVEGGLDAVGRLSRASDVSLSFTGFEDFTDELLTGVVVDGVVTVHGSRPVLDGQPGSLHDEDGCTLDRDLLAEAGAVIARRPPEPDGSTLLCGLETALVIADELGRFARDTCDFLSEDAPEPMALDAVARMAQTALRVSCAGASRTAGELSYLAPLRLTQAVVHAGLDEYHETPGTADWLWWLGLLAGSVGALVDEVHMCDITPVQLDVDPDWPDPSTRMEEAARDVVTTCVQALALFASPAARGQRGSER